MAQKANAPGLSGDEDLGFDHFLVAWRSPDGTVTSIGPLPRARAETIVEAYGEVYPEQTFWVQPMRAEITEARLGRTRRARALPRTESDL